MSNQIFKYNVPNDFFFGFLEKVCDNCEVNNIKSIIFTKISFNKLKYYNLVEPFCHKLKKYYHNSKPL